jgi:hypothetical protein
MSARLLNAVDFRLYHDESKKAGYWHGILLIPEKSRIEVLSLLERARANTGFSHALSIKGVKKRHGPVYLCAQSWILLGIGLMRNKLGKTSYAVHYGEKSAGKLKYEILRTCLGVKFILFREKHDHARMQLVSQYANKVETTFRIGLKGGLNLFSSEGQSIHIIKMHFDGHEHLGRRIDRKRIIDRIAGLKDSCSISNAENIIDDRCSDHAREDSQDYADCQFLQLTDLLVGSFRTIMGECTRNIHKNLAYSARLPIEAFLRHISGFDNSRWYGSFCMSQCEIVDGHWVFSRIDPLKETKEIQLEL